MGLDEVGFGGAARFDGIRIDCALAENPLSVDEVAGLQEAFLNLDELFADGEALGLGLMQACEGRHEFRFGVLDLEMSGTQRGEYSADELGLIFSHEACVDVQSIDALGTQRAEAKCVGDGGVNAAANEEENVAVSGSLA